MALVCIFFEFSSVNSKGVVLFYDAVLFVFSGSLKVAKLQKVNLS
jgi:hypothetical protein